MLRIWHSILYVTCNHSARRGVVLAVVLAKESEVICMSARRLGRANPAAIILAAITALIALTGAIPSVPVIRPKPAVLQMVGSGQNVWAVIQSGSQIALWSTQGPSRSWTHLGWPRGMDPVQLVRAYSDAWAVSIANQLYTTTNGGTTWAPVPLPRLLSAHPHWAQGLRAASIGPHTLALLAWGPEAAFQSAKLLWISPNNGHSWTRVAHSIAGPLGTTVAWWPKNTEATLPTSGDPEAFKLLGSHHGYLISTTAGGPFLWKTANAGRAWAPVSVVGLPRRQEDEGVMIDNTQWKNGIGWVAVASGEGPALIRLTQTTASIVALPPRLTHSVAAAMISATSGVVVGQAMGDWELLTTTDSGKAWTSLKLDKRILPSPGPVSQIYATPQRLWVVLTGQLYTGLLSNAKAWHTIKLP